MRKDHDAAIAAINGRGRKGFSAEAKKTRMLRPCREGNDKDVLFFNLLIINTGKGYCE